MLGFDDYPDIAARLRSILAGERAPPAHPAGPPQAAADLARPTATRRRVVPCPGTRSPRPTCPAAPAPGQRPARRTPPPRRRPDGAAEAGQRLRPALLVLRDPELPRLVRLPPARPTCSPRRAGWPAQGVRELFLVSENSTSYGKDLGDLRLLETLLPELAAVDGIERVRVSYLQPAETRPGLVEAIATTPGVAPTSTCPSSTPARPVLRRMRRFGDPESFLGAARPGPRAGARGRRPLQRHRRLPRRDRGRPRRRCATSWSRPGST